MNRPRVSSIRRYLLVSLIVALSSGALLVAGFTYWNTANEIDEVYDKSMMELAETLKSQMQALTVGRYHVKSTFGPALNERIKDEQEFLVQVWDKGRQSVYTSHRAIPFPFQEARGGVGVNGFKGNQWRTYGTDTDLFVIQVSQPQEARNRYVREISLHLLLPLLLLVPVVGGLALLAVGRSLTPLNDISLAITKRSATSLEPLSEGNIPLEIQPLVRELNKLLVRLNAALEAQRRFTADAAHQLRTPLTALQLQLGNLKRARGDDDRERNAAALQSGIDRATHVVQQLLVIARLEPSAMEAQSARVDLVGLVREVVEFHADMAVQKDIGLGFSHGESIMVPGSTENLRILLDNLLGNALRYTPVGGKVNVSVLAESGHAVVEVEDNGIGIPESERERVFERFHRVLGTEVEGTGLGLSIADNIVKQHGGTICVGDGIDGKGASFSVRLPVKRES